MGQNLIKIPTLILIIITTMAMVIMKIIIIWDTIKITIITEMEQVPNLVYDQKIDNMNIKYTKESLIYDSNYEW